MGFLNNFMKELTDLDEKDREKVKDDREAAIQKIMDDHGLERAEAILVYEGINDVTDFENENTEDDDFNREDS